MFDLSFYKLIKSLNHFIFVMHQAKKRTIELKMVSPINIMPKDPKFDENVMSLYPI